MIIRNFKTPHFRQGYGGQAKLPTFAKATEGKQNSNKNRKFTSGFTLIELLIVISLIGILTGFSAFGLQTAKGAARDATRKSHLESLRSALELYKSDCGDYPASLPAVGSSLVGDGTPAACSASNTYIAGIPDDPTVGKDYRYYRLSANSYEICAALEQNTTAITCGGVSSACGSGTCSYRVLNP